MDYKEKYEQALEKAKNIYRLGYDIANIAEEIFPELAENEDEKIRQKIIEAIKGDMAVGETKDKEAALAWLERQKSVDKIEHRYNIGDCIIHQGTDNIYRVIGVNDKQYHLETLDASRCYWNSISLVDRNSRLWTIQDAKEGDVLYSPFCKILWIYKNSKECYVANNLNYHSDSPSYITIDTPIIIPDDACPASKRWKVIFFQKLREAGYE